MLIFDKYFCLILDFIYIIQCKNINYQLKYRKINSNSIFIESFEIFLCYPTKIFKVELYSFMSPLLIINTQKELKNNLDTFILNRIEDENKDLIIYKFIDKNISKIDYISNIDIGICKTKVKLYNKISNNPSLLTENLDKYGQRLLIIPKVEYEVIKRDSNIPLIINTNNLTKNNLFNKYYQNIIFLYKKRNNTYMTVKIKKYELYKKKLNSDLEIILTIKGKDTQQILNNKSVRITYQDFIFDTKPSEILVNGNKANIIDFYVYNLTLEENNVMIKFNKTLTNFNMMFYGLSNITYIKLNSLDSLKVTNMVGMFYGCKNLISLDINNIDTSLVTNMNCMFRECNNLISLDLSNFKTSSSLITTGSMFRNCRNLMSLDIKNFDTSFVTDMGCMFSNCSKLISLDLNNLNMSSATVYGGIFDNCTFLYCINNVSQSNQKLINEISKYKFKNNNICSDICFDKNKKIIYSNKTCSLNCPESDKYSYKNICYSLCPSGTHNLSNNTCIRDNDIIINSDISSDIITSFISEISTININNIENKNNISLINQYDEFFNDIIINSQNSSNDKDNIIINVDKEIMNGNLDKFISNIIEKENKNIIMEYNNIKAKLTSSDNQQNNQNNNISTISLGICEKNLKLKYNISDNETLLIFKKDIYVEGLLIPTIEYEVYNIKTKEKLDLNICKDTKIDLNIPVIIDENNLYKYNLSSEYYNDICYTDITGNNADILLRDRKNDYTKKNMFLCEKNCNYKGYNYDSKKVICECEVKTQSSLVSEIIANKDKVINNIKDVKNIININIMKCYYKIFKKETIIKNIGNYFISIIIILTIILCILFRIKGYDKLKNQIKIIIDSKNSIISCDLKEKINDRTKIVKIKKRKIKKTKKINLNINSIKTIGENTDKIGIIFGSKNSNSFINAQKNNYIYNIKNNENNASNGQNSLVMKKTLNHNIIKFNDYEINNLIYKEALKYDKRTYFQFYFSLLKMNHIIMFTFLTRNDYNSKSIKIILFLFSFSLYLTVNALFFNEETIHKIYEDHGTFNISYQIPQILYSTIITSFINLIIKNFSLSEKKILEIKHSNGEINLSKVLNYLIIKFIVFFILIFSFLILFWFYLSCFCAIYINTQIHLIKDTLISFGLSLIYPFGLYFLSGIFRIPSLKNSNRECLYKISKIIQIL